MSLLGKILLFVNLLAGAGFAYLAIQDWKGRQTITAVGHRHLLLLHGLPLGGKDVFGSGNLPDQLPAEADAEVRFPVEGPGGVYTETISPAVLKAYFAQAGGGAAPAEGQVSFATNTPVPNQLAEVKRVYAQVKGAIDKQDGQKAKATAAYGWLQYQPETYDERVELLALYQADQGDALANRLYARFDRVINPPQASPGEGQVAAKDEGERRGRLAHLLVHLDTDPAWQKRVMMVVGVRQYARTVGEQAVRFQVMAARVDRLIADDQDEFIAKYAQLKGQAIERTQMVRDRAETRARVEEQKRKDTDFVAQRTTQLATLKTELQKLKAEVDALLARQTESERQVFAVEREVALTLEDIYRLEAELVKAEKERYAPKK